MTLPTTFKTARLCLKPPAIEDAPAIADLNNDEELARNASRIPHPYTLENAQDYIEAMTRLFETGTEYTFIAFLEGTLIADVSVRKTDNIWSLGYGVHRSHRGKGYATEAAHGLCALGFAHLALSEIHAGHYDDNPASGQVLRKLGFAPTGEKTLIFSKGRGEEVASTEYILHAKNFKREL